MELEVGSQVSVSNPYDDRRRVATIEKIRCVTSNGRRLRYVDLKYKLSNGNTIKTTTWARNLDRCS